VSDAPKVLGREMQQRGTRWLAKFGPLEYVIETAQPHIAEGDCITWIYYDYATNGARCAGRSVPVVGPLHWCIEAIERELLSIREAIPEPMAPAVEPHPTNAELIATALEAHSKLGLAVMFIVDPQPLMQADAHAWNVLKDALSELERRLVK